jgi:hypothetical protein
MIYYITNHQQTTRMIIQTILPTKRSSILLPTSLVQSEMTKRTGIKFSGTIYHCPENPDGYNIIDPKIDGAVVGLIQQILCFTPDYVLLFETPDFISKEDYKEMADIPGIDRVFIVNVGENQSPIDKDYQLDASIFAQYFKKSELTPKKRWLLTVDVKQEKEDESVAKKQKIEITPPTKVNSLFTPVPPTPPLQTPVSTPGSEGGRRTPTHPSNYWDEKDITKCAWSQEILPNHIEKLPAYKVYGITEIKNIPVPVDSKSHMICNYSNGKIYMNQRTTFQRSDFNKMTQLIQSGTGRKVYAFNRVVGYYETDRMVYHHY